MGGGGCHLSWFAHLLDLAIFYLERVWLAMKLEDPYWAMDYTGIFSWDFNKEFIPPGTKDTPFTELEEQGLITIRYDDDFWVCAVLPWERYKDKSIQEIVAEFWPETLEKCRYNKDVWWNDQFKNEDI